jgi:hypothetical protein
MEYGTDIELAKATFAASEPSDVIKLGFGVLEPVSRKGKSPFGDMIEKTLASIGARPGDVVEVDEHGTARVVGRRPRIAGEQTDMSEQAILAALKRIYGDDVASVVNVTAGANVVVFRKPNHT